MLTVGIYKKLPFAILQGVDVPVDQPLDLPDISSKVGICKKLPFAILQGVHLLVDLLLVLPGISSHSRNLLEIAICQCISCCATFCQASAVGICKKLPLAILQGVDLPVGQPLDLPGISSQSRNL